jgi:transitional endoplasmic reticulum ATPase
VVDGPEIFSQWQGESEEMVRSAFALAARLAPCILLIDQLDALAASRSADATGASARVVSQLLTQLERGRRADGIVVVGATNRLDLIDAALLRPGRFDLVLEVPVPTAPERHAILAGLLARSSAAVAEDALEVLEGLSRQTVRATPSDLRQGVEQAVRLALRRRIDHGDDRAQVTGADLRAAWGDAQPLLRAAITSVI